MEPVLLNGRYRLLELVGSGGMATVYRGLDTLLGREVAVKALRHAFASDPAFLARFRREAQAAAQLQHPNVVTVYDVGQDGDWHYIVMEYVRGQDLKTVIRQRGPLSIGEALDIAVQICAGAGHAHRIGLVHCDIKPQNVLVTEEGWAKVTDFGIARALSELGLTESEIVWGSPIYFSPEQATGESPSPASDVYSIGVLLYEALAGSPPFIAEKSAALALMHMHEEPPPLAARNPQVPAQLESIVRTALAKDPAARYRTADHLGRVLDDYRRRTVQETGMEQGAQSSPVHTPGDAPTTPAPMRQVDSVTTMLAIIAFVAVVGLIPLWWLVYRSYAAPPSAPLTTTPGASVTQTPLPKTVRVPDLVGKSVEEAKARLSSLGLRYAVEERYDPDAQMGIVLEQFPAPSEQAAQDTQVSLVVSGAGRELVMPDLAGYPLETVQEGLETDGLRVSTEQAWSGQPPGTVIGQEPPGGTQIRAGDAVTLTVSGGTDVPIRLEASMADLFVLQSAQLRQAVFRPGAAIAVTLRWWSRRATDARYTVFVHLIGPDGRLAAQEDMEPSEPTTNWGANRIVTDPHQVLSPSDLPAGRYQLRAGMYETGQPSARLPVVDPGFTTAQDNSILIAEIDFRP